MFRNFPRPLGYLAPIALVAFLCAPQIFAQKTKVVSSVNSPLSLTLTSDSNVVTECADGGAPQVRLTAKAVSPGGYPIKYKWTTTAGTISGDGPEVTWNLAGLKPGYHKASVDIQSIGSDGSCQAFSSVSVLVNPCAAVQPVCPAVEIVCPTNVALDQPLTFSSRVTGGVPANVAAVYNWTVSAGTIISGQGTDTIKVDTTGLGGQSVRASLSVGGYNLECAADCAVSIPLPKLISRRFDEFPDIARNDEKARLDNYGIELQNDPTATAYVVVYPGRASKRGEAQQHFGRIIDYLVNSRGLDKSRIVTLVGPARDKLQVELWITPQGATPPNP
jgi:PKD domain-containing protein